MPEFNECVPGRPVRIRATAVQRVRGKRGVIVEVSRSRRASDDPMIERVTVDIEGHGDVVVAPADLELLED